MRRSKNRSDDFGRLGLGDGVELEGVDGWECSREWKLVLEINGWCVFLERSF
jgi:hypothetical protein